MKYEVPFVYAGVVGTHAMQMNVLPGSGACLRCVFAEPPVPGTQPTCENVGCWWCGGGDGGRAAGDGSDETDCRANADVRRTLGQQDVWTSRWREIEVERDVQCVTCGVRGGLSFWRARSGRRM